MEVNNNNIKYWDNLYKERNINRDDIIYDDWLRYYGKLIDRANGIIVDLGCGSGNNCKYLIERKKKVVACDASEEAIKRIKSNFPEVEDTKCFNMLDGFPFINNYSDMVIADLCLHYFTREDTIKILKEIKRILENKGHMLVRVNALDEVNMRNIKLEEVENHLYKTVDGRYKRFFDYGDLFDFFNMFEFKNIEESYTDRYGTLKKTYNLCLRNRK